MSIKNLFAIILKLTGFFFIIKIFIITIPEQIGLLASYDDFFPQEIRVQQAVPVPIIIIFATLIILLFLYYITIRKTEIFIKFLNIEKYFGDTRIENLNIPLQKYVQIAILIISIILLLFSIPQFIKQVINYYGFIESFTENLIADIISNSIIILISFLSMLFSDKLSKGLTS